MSQKIESVENILAEILNFILAAAVETLIFAGFLKYWPGNLRMLFLVFVPVLYYLIRRFCNNAFLFFLMHFMVAAGVMALYSRQMGETVVFGIFSILFAVFSIIRKLSEGKTGMSPMNPLGAACFFFVVYLIDSLQAEGVCGSRIMQLMIIYMLIYFLYYYLINFDLYIDLSNRTTEHISAGRAFGASFGMMAGFLGISGLIISLFSDRQLADRIGSAIRNFLKRVLIFFFSLFPEGAEEEAVIPGSTGSLEMSEMMESAEKTGPSLLGQIINAVFYIVSVIAILALLAAAVIAILRFLKSVFGKRMQKRMTEKSEENDKIESLILTKKKKGEAKKERFSVFGRAPDQSVRKLYLKTICRKYRILKEEKTEKLILHGTAKECCLSLFPDRTEEALWFSELYEKARYGSDVCSREEVSRMKHLAQQLMK